MKHADLRGDITDRRDIDSLMTAFYGRAMSDDLIGYFFNEVAPLDLEEHLPRIGDFWETLLLGSGDYRRHGRNPLLIHAGIDAREHLRPEHFERWLELFHACVDEQFSGTRAEGAKMRSRMIAQRMTDFAAAYSAVAAQRSR